MDTSDTFTLGVSSWSQGYDGAGRQRPHGNRSRRRWATTTTLDRQPGRPDLPVRLHLADQPDPDGEGPAAPNNNSIHILAIDVVSLAPQVNLGTAIDNASPPDNVVAVTTNSEASEAGAGIDGSGDTYSETALGGSSLTWNSQSFSLGATTIASAVAAEGQTIALPQGYYASLEPPRAHATGSAAPSVTFTVNYVGGGTATFTQTLSGWLAGYTGYGTTAPGESIAAGMTSYNTPSGTLTGTHAYLYGYVFPVNPAAMVASIVFPTNSKVTVLAIDEVSQTPRVNLGNATAANPADNVDALTFTAGAGFAGTGIDGNGDTYSLNALASVTGSAAAVTWNSQNFNLGPAYADDAVAAEGQTIPLPAGQFTSIELLGTGVNGAQSGVTFTINYVGGGTATMTQTFSDWKTGYTGTGGTTAPGESIAEESGSFDTPSGSEAGKTYLYAYIISTSSAQTVASIQFPHDADVIILAIDEINAARQAATPTAVLATTDTTTKGNWIGAYRARATMSWATRPAFRAMPRSRPMAR